MPYLIIGAHDYDRSWTSPGPRGVARLFRAGTHEITEELAAIARDEAPNFVRITDTDPGAVNLHREGPLTRDEINMGTRAADEKARADRLAAEVERLTAEVTAHQPGPQAGDPEAADPFYCNFCDDKFPTEEARERHESMNHADPEPEAPVTEPGPEPTPAARKPRAPRKVTK